MTNANKPVKLLDAEKTIQKFVALDSESRNYVLGYMEAMLQTSEHSKSTKPA